VKWLDIVPWIMARTERFPKNLRYSLSQKIDNTCLEVLELIVQAIYSPLLGWRTLIIWECMIRESNDTAKLIDIVESWLLSGEASTEIGLVGE
jgi:G:T-mismatch repair DNA endonuclease (very short patch repair protein)